ncbi:nucleotidyltransferase family protein [Alteromonas sp. 1_MG-2023]|uniref:nucleotidyltransferase family protein n=1 Tax=Alteromonas sp. 1_MG-2023 TaxID=3062669 RepID=UPI0026E46E19|nr:nucleotidyltransferase family protein [Alteromonas sp. 1_MG-2023]MDO6475428.1 nucleotidyltransferase family protein [Alteromonas sp. 1_MG-2023]
MSKQSASAESTLLMAKYIQCKHVLKKLEKIASEIGCDILVLKGFAMNSIFYGDTEKRNFFDLDIFVEKSFQLEFLDKCIRIGKLLEKSENVGFFHNYYEKTVVIDNFPVDIHFRLCNPNILELNDEMMLNASIPVEFFKSGKIRFLNLEDTLIHLASHIINDGFLNHYSVVDICKVLNKFSINKQELLIRCKILGAKKIYKFLISLIQDIKGEKPYKPFYLTKNRSKNYFIRHRNKLFASIYFRGIARSSVTVIRSIIKC